MARSVKWQLNFMSTTNVNCRVDIYKEGYEGEPIQLTGAANPFEYQENGGTDLLHFVRYKTGYIRLVELNFGDLDDLYPDTITSRYVCAYYGSELVFTGYLQCQEFSTDYAPGPRILSFPIISPLGLLDKITIKSTAEEFDDLNFSLSEISFGAWITLILKHLNVNYADVIYPGDSLAPWNIMLYSTIIIPFNSSFKCYDDPDKIYSPRPLKYIVDGLCAWRNWIVHDTPNAIVFQHFMPSDSDNYCSIATANLPWHDISQPPFNSLGPISSALFSDNFKAFSDDATQTCRPPLKSLTISADGSPLRQSLDTTFIQISEHGAPQIIDPRIFTSEYGGLGVTFAPGFNADNPSLCYTITLNDINRTTSVKLIGVNFSDIATSCGYLRFNLKVSIRRPSDDDYVSSSLPHLSLYIQSNDVTFIDGSDHSHLTVFETDDNGQFEVPIYTSANWLNDLKFQHVTINIYSWDLSGLPAGTRIKIDEMSLRDSVAPNVGSVFQLFLNDKYKKSEKIIVGSDFGIEDKSITVNFQNYMEMHCSHSFSTNNQISSEIPDYSYMFRPQRFLEIPVRTTSSLLQLSDFYLKQWSFPGGDWIIISDSFKMADDIHTFTLAKL